MKSLLMGILLTLIYMANGNAANASAKNIGCPKTEWTEACYDHTGGGRRIKAQYLNRIKFERNGFAVLRLVPYETVAVNRKGDVVVPGINSGNYSYKDAEGGIAIFSFRAKNSTSDFNEFNCGYFRLSDFKIVVPPIYNRCDHFHKQKALVCKNCRPDCIECNVTAYYGGEGFEINAKHEILKRFPLPKLPACSTVEGVGGYPKGQPCRQPDGLAGD